MHLITPLLVAVLGVSAAALTFDEMGAITCSTTTPGKLIVKQQTGPLSTGKTINFKYSDCAKYCVCSKGTKDAQGRLMPDINCFVTEGLDADQLWTINNSCNGKNPKTPGAGCACVNGFLGPGGAP